VPLHRDWKKDMVFRVSFIPISHPFYRELRDAAGVGAKM
jgi:hypothetical protein